MPQIIFLSAACMADQIRTKKLSSLELIKAHLARIEKLNPALNAFAQVDSDGALDQARSADEAINRNLELGPLHGVPLSIKSSIEVKGLRCEAGSRLRTGVVASKDALLVSRLRDAGAVILGTSNTPELLMAWETDNLLYGRANNPWDLTRTPGGSSGGEGAAIASGCSAGGVGSDGGGSIRIPAHFCGICGLKPTPGRIPAVSHFPPSLGPFALLGVVGPMARTVPDLKLLFEVMQGRDEGDLSTAAVPVRWPSLLELRKLRIGYFEDDGRTPVTQETRAAVRDAAQALKRAGFDVRPFSPEGLEEAGRLWWQLFGVAGAMVLRPMTEGREAELSPILTEFLRIAGERPHTAEALLDAWLARDRLRAQIFEQMREYPLLLCPVASIPAFRHGERSWIIDGKAVKYLDAWSYCEWFNLLGMPAVAVPFARSAEGLPIGVQISTRPWEEEVALSVAEILEKECGGWKAPPTGLLPFHD
ncbi:MAG TPA: amidase [Terriglobales bacterium]|nr:amidase [Terriglobales bacterium]